MVDAAVIFGASKRNAKLELLDVIQFETDLAKVFCLCQNLFSRIKFTKTKIHQTKNCQEKIERRKFIKQEIHQTKIRQTKIHHKTFTARHSPQEIDQTKTHQIKIHQKKLTKQKFTK